MTAIAQAPTSPSLIVFGRDRAGKAHASWFDTSDAELATKAAGLMNMDAVPVHSEQLRAFAGTLPKGRVFSSGRAFTPFVAGALYQRLLELTRDVLKLVEAKPQPLGAKVVSIATATGSKGKDASKGDGGDKSPGDETGKVAGDGGAPEGSGAVVTLPQRPDDIGIGSQLLAHESVEDGWWEAVVVGINGSMLTLSWRDYSQPSFVRPRNQVAFLPLPVRA